MPLDTYEMLLIILQYTIGTFAKRSTNTEEANFVKNNASIIFKSFGHFCNNNNNNKNLHFAAPCNATALT